MIKVVLTEEQLLPGYFENMCESLSDDKKMKSDDWACYRIEYGYPSAFIEREIFLPKNLAPEIIEALLNFTQRCDDAEKSSPGSTIVD